MQGTTSINVALSLLAQSSGLAEASLCRRPEHRDRTLQYHFREVGGIKTKSKENALQVPLPKQYERV